MYTKFGWEDFGEAGKRGPRGPQGDQGPIGPDGPQGDPGADGADGIGILWQGSLSAAPGSPQLNWAYYNTTDKKSYIWDGNSWEVLCQDATNASLTFPIEVTRPNSTDDLIRSKATGNVEWAALRTADGGQYFGNGTNTWDTFMGRTGFYTISITDFNKTGNGTLKVEYLRTRSITSEPGVDLSLNTGGVITCNGQQLTNTLFVNRSLGSGNIIYSTRFSSDTYNRFAIYNDGSQGWSNNTASLDTFMRRYGSGQLAITSTRTNAVGGSLLCETLQPKYILGDGTGTGNVWMRLSTSMVGSGSLSSGEVFNSGSYYCFALGEQITCINSTKSYCIGTGCTVNGTNGNLILCDASNAVFSPPGAGNTLESRFVNGFYLFTANDKTSGQRLTGSSWASVSDSRVKNIKNELKCEGALDALDDFELYDYEFKSCPGKVCGPMAQGFYGAFGSLLEKPEPPSMEYRACSEINEDKTVGKKLGCGVEDGDKLNLLDSRDEMTAAWLCIKELRAENLSLKSELSGVRAANNDLRDEIEMLKVEMEKRKDRELLMKDFVNDMNSRLLKLEAITFASQKEGFVIV